MTYSHFLDLPEWEQLEYIADDVYLQRQYRKLRKALIRTNKGKKYVEDMGAYVRLGEKML